MLFIWTVQNCAHFSSDIAFNKATSGLKTVTICELSYPNSTSEREGATYMYIQISSYIFTVYLLNLSVCRFVKGNVYIICQTCAHCFVLSE